MKHEPIQAVLVAETRRLVRELIEEVSRDLASRSHNPAVLLDMAVDLEIQARDCARTSPGTPAGKRPTRRRAVRCPPSGNQPLHALVKECQHRRPGTHIRLGVVTDRLGFLPFGSLLAGEAVNRVAIEMHLPIGTRSRASRLRNLCVPLAG